MTNYFLEQYFGREQAHKMAYFSKIQHFSIRKGHFRIFLGHLLIIFFYKKEEKLMIFQKNINPAMSDYCRSHTECYKVVEERKVLCTLIMQTTSWLISTIYVLACQEKLKSLIFTLAICPWLCIHMKSHHKKFQDL